MVADVQQLIQKILSDPKIAASSNFASKIYHDEPILVTAPQLERFTPPRIREMRKLAKGGGDATVFYEQGRFMEDFEDDFDYKGEYVQYFPTYQAMSDAQLRGYFSWRTRLRRGQMEKTSLSFVFVHIYELLHHIGSPTVLAGFHALRDFWTRYREFDRRIDAYVELWLKDYVVYHNLDKSLLEGLADNSFDQAAAVLLDHKAHDADAVFAALNSLSSYDLAESKFFKLYPDEVKEAVHKVFAAVSDHYNRNPDRGAREKLFGRICANPYFMFRSAVFHERTPVRNAVYEFGNHHRYLCENGVWTCERFVWYGLRNKRIGALLKTIDYIMRRRRGYKSSLQPGKTSKILTGKIEKVLARHEEATRQSAAPVVEIDVAKLHGIRSAALDTQNKLLIAEPEAAAEDAPAAAAPPPGDGSGLDEVERRFLHCLLAGESYADLLRSRGLLLSVLVDGINAKLFDRLGDTAIVDDSGRPTLLDDYREDVKGMIAT